MNSTQAPAKPSGRVSTATDPIEALRAATRDLHQLLDDNLPLGRPGATLLHYASHLQMLSEWQTSLHPWLQRTATSPDGHDFLEQDLATCLILDPEIQRQCRPSPIPVDLTALTAADDGSDAFCWGLRYVLEGSRLGGQLLYRRLREALFPHPLRYLAGPPPGAPGWHETLSQLRKNLATDQQRHSACRGAVASFELLLSRARHEFEIS